MSKTMVRIPLLTILTLCALVGLCSLLISTIGRNYINDHGPELIGRKLHIENLQINLFTGHAEIDSLTLYEPDATTSFFSFRHLQTDVEMTRLLTGMVDIDYIHLEGLKLHVTQCDTIFNFSDIIRFFNSESTQTTPTDTDTSAAGIPLIIRDIDIANSYVRYQDLAVGSDFKFNDFSLHIPGIDLSHLEAALGVKLDFVEGGSLTTSILYKDVEQTYDIALQLANFNISGLLPYTQQSLRVNLLRGILDADIHIQGELEHAMNFDLSGAVDVKQFAMTDGDDMPVLLFDSLSLSIDRINLQDNEIRLGTLSILHPQTCIMIGSDSIDNYTRMLGNAQSITDTTATDADTATTADRETTPLQFSIAKLEVQNAALGYYDKSLPIDPFSYELSDLNLTAQNLDLNDVNHIQVDALLQKTGNLRLTYDGKLDDMSNMNLILNLRNIGLTDFSPYTLPMFGCPVSSGTLAVTSQTLIKNNELRGTNDVVIYKPGVDKKRHNIHPEINAPLKLGLYVLTDKYGKCEMNLPVSGNIASPEFSYKKMIFKVLGNLLIKVATSPFGLSSGSSDYNTISFSSMMSDWTAEDYEKLNAIATLMKEKPEVKINFLLTLNHANALDEIACGSLKRAYYITLHPEKTETQLDLFDRTALQNISLDAPAIQALADSLMAQRQLTVDARTDIHTKARIIYGSEAEAIIGRIEEARNGRLRRYMIEQKGIADNRITISCAKREAMDANQGKHTYTIGMELNEESTDAKSDTVE